MSPRASRRAGSPTAETQGVERLREACPVVFQLVEFPCQGEKQLLALRTDGPRRKELKEPYEMLGGSRNKAFQAPLS